MKNVLKNYFVLYFDALLEDTKTLLKEIHERSIDYMGFLSPKFNIIEEVWVGEPKFIKIEGSFARLTEGVDGKKNWPMI